MTRRLKTTAAYPYGGRSLVVGEEFDASEQDADLLTLVGRAIHVPAPSARTVQTRDLEPAETETEPEQAPTTRTKRRYQRRDLTAEP